MARPVIHDRNEALARAQDLFWRKGFHATSLKDLEAGLGMKPGSIYAAFGSKEGLFVEALGRYAAATGAELAEALAGATDPLAGLADFARSLGRLRERELPAAACMLARAIAELTPEQEVAQAEAERLMAEMEAALAAGFAAAQVQGLIGPDQDPGLLGARLQIEILGLRLYAQRRDAPAALPALAGSMAAWIEGLRRDAQGGARREAGRAAGGEAAVAPKRRGVSRISMEEWETLEAQALERLHADRKKGPGEAE